MSEHSQFPTNWQVHMHDRLNAYLGSAGQPSVEDVTANRGGLEDFDDSSAGIATPTTSDFSDGDLEKADTIVGSDNDDVSELTPLDPQPMSDSEHDAFGNTSATVPDRRIVRSARVDQRRARHLVNSMGDTNTHFFTSAAEALQLSRVIQQCLAHLSRTGYTNFKNWAENNPKLFIFVVCCVIAGVSAGPILAAIGFTAGGIAAGSLAALIHSLIGNVAAGSAFAILQSLGATGLLATAGMGFAVAVPALVAFYAGLQEDGWIRVTGKRFLEWVKDVFEERYG